VTRPVLIDASSAILLFKAALFEPLAAAYRLLVSESVGRELTRPGYPGAEIFEEAIETGRLTRQPAGLGETVLPASLHAGERDTITLMLAGRADFVIVDDRPAALCCRRLHLPYVNALLCPRILRLAGRLSPVEAADATIRLLDLGRYGRQIVAFARDCGDARLIFFAP
jgi:predicted nucleic acid-binding protein